MSNQIITATGAAVYPILPSYEVKFTVREPHELVQKDDYLCIGSNPHDLHSWARLHPESPMVGKPANHFTNKHIGFKHPIA